ncbi:PDZ domain-containing protein [Paenarthrobacter sp. DKR-5]|uniref:YlbL family protein n=1 Tax=Paenarthrobacter sp. DKR-5 TaxID=2835535 RepID=UPI001BDC082A|nr:PDZ domain-containing protein [Paenarthrobacter sp. DKR-5]MBT1002959.1 PDZ domain-containing protein [Paenarthrobacter sp. DKR-5]
MVSSGILAAGLIVVAALMPVPYVVEAPGPTFNTLGKDQGTPVIQVNGHQSYPASGSLDLTTVYVNGGPNGAINIFEAYRSWLDRNRSVVPEEELYPAGTSQQEVQQQNTVAMSTSQENATAAALGLENIPFKEHLLVADFAKGSPSKGKLQAGDELTAVNGKKIKGLETIQQELASGAGAPIRVDVLRGGRTVSETITPMKADGRYLLGVVLQYKYDFPFSVKISLAQVGGPSAGMMFALGIVDTLTPGDLTGGKHFAGTGTIDADGKVGPIGGIAQKLVGARNSGATVFLAPGSNCDEVVGHVPDGLSVVKVETLQQAYDAVKSIGSGTDPSTLATCTAK